MGSGAVHALTDRLITLVQDVDYLLTNQDELYIMTGENSISDAVTGLAEYGIERLVVKVGEMGSIVITPELTELVEGLAVDDVVNSAGRRRQLHGRLCPRHYGRATTCTTRRAWVTWQER